MDLMFKKYEIYIYQHIKYIHVCQAEIFNSTHYTKSDISGIKVKITNNSGQAIETNVQLIS